MTGGAVELLFVYGTLMPGHLRWGMLEPHAVDRGEAAVPGELWDTGRGWPAATFGGAVDRLVPGWWVRLAPDALDDLLPVLDEMEGVSDPPAPAVDPYVRVEVVVPSVGRAWAYHATRIPTGWRRIDRWANQPEA